MAFANFIYGSLAIASLLYDLTRKDDKERVAKPPPIPPPKTYEQDAVSRTDPVPIAYGTNKLVGFPLYREESDGYTFDCVVGLCEGEVAQIGEINVNDTNLSETTDITVIRAVGSKTQTGAEMLQEGVIRVLTTADATVDADDAATNFGSSDFIKVYQTGGVDKRYSFIKFDLSELPGGLTIELAKMIIRCNSAVDDSQAATSPGVILFNSDSENWAEDTITWTNKPATGATTVANHLDIHHWSQPYVYDFVAGGVTALQTAYDGGSTFTIVAEPFASENPDVNFSSKDSPWQTPFIEITYSGSDAIAYRNTAHLALTIATSNDTTRPFYNNDYPDVSAVVKGLKVTNLDTGVIEYSDNPAYILYDFLVNTRYGLSIDSTEFNTASFVTAAAFCDASITGPNGTSEKRYTCSLLVESRTNGESIVRDILNTFGGYLYQQDGTIYLGYEYTGSSSHTFTEDNILSDTFAFSELDKEDVANEIKLFFRDESREYQPTIVIARDEPDVDDRELVAKEVRMPGITRETQATRIANLLLYKGLLTNYTCQFNVSVKNGNVSIGDLCAVTHSVPAWTSEPFRIVAINETDDDELEIICEQYVAQIYSDSGIPSSYQEAVPFLRRQRPWDVPPHATNLSLSETSEIRDDGSYQPKLLITWTKPDYLYPLQTIVWVRKGAGGTWEQERWNNGERAEVNVDALETYYVTVQIRQNYTGIITPFATSLSGNQVISGQSSTPYTPYLKDVIFTDGTAKAVWSAGKIWYRGTEFSIGANDTTDEFISFDPDASITELQTSAVKPTPAADDNEWVIAHYDAGTDTVTLADTEKVIHGSLIIDGSITITETNITMDTITEGATYQRVLATYITAGKIVLGYGTFATLDGATQRIELAGPPSNTLTFYDDANAAVVTIDDDANGYVLVGVQATNNWSRIGGGFVNILADAGALAPLNVQRAASAISALATFYGYDGGPQEAVVQFFTNGDLTLGGAVTAGGDLSIKGSISMIALETVDGRDVSVDGGVLDGHVGAGGAAHADVVAAGADGFMTGAMATKLAGIEALADKTDATNVGAAMSDGVHGTRGGGALHADVVAGSADGFMTATMATKLAGIATGADVTGDNPPQAHNQANSTITGGTANAIPMYTAGGVLSSHPSVVAAELTQINGLTSHALQDNDFAAAGFCKTNGAGTYSVQTDGVDVAHTNYDPDVDASFDITIVNGLVTEFTIN